jgi:Ca-activated chloride channel homolog
VNAVPLLAPEELARSRTAGEEAGAGSLATERGNLPLERLDVRARITGLVADVVLTQTFVNRFDLPLQATYIFPLPDRAAVGEFRMEAGDRVVEGVLHERAEAREAYDQAVAEGRMAAIAEEDRPGVFTMRVGNLMPGERATVRLAMSGPLPWDQGEATFRFPLVVAPRYIPGTPLPVEPAGDGVEPDTDAVPDASRITPPVLLPGFPNPVRLSIEVEVDPAGLPVGEPRSSLHAVVIDEREGAGGTIRVVRAVPGERPDRDFVLRVRVGSGSLATSLVAVPDWTDGTDSPDSPDSPDKPDRRRRPGQPDSPDQPDGRPGQRGTFLLTVMPPPPAGATRPRDLALVLDRSGSMSGWKIVAARRAAARLLDSLEDRDRIALLAFSNDVERLPAPDAGTAGAEGGPGLVPATDRWRFRAIEFLARLGAQGGTEMAHPLLEALDALGPAEPGRDRVLVLVTDGQVGNEDQILRLLCPRLGDLRVYAVGVDTAVNEGFLRRLAIAGGGACELVESEDRLDEALDRVRQRIGTPVVADLTLHAQGFEIEPGTVSPPRLPALLAGAPLVVSGRYRGEPAGGVDLRGKLPGGRDWHLEVPVTAANTPDSAEPRLIPADPPTPASPAGPPTHAIPVDPPTRASRATPFARVWARAHVRDLEDAYASGAAGFGPDELERRIVRTSLDFGVLSRFTAFVALDTVVVNRDGRLHRVTQPVDVPHGWAHHELNAVPVPRAVSPMTLAMPARPGGLLPVPDRVMSPRRPSMAPPPWRKLPPLLRNTVKAGTGQGRRFWRTPADRGLPQDPGEGTTLDAYRRRAASLAAELDAAPAPTLRERLGRMAAEIAGLVADLESVCPDLSEIGPLRELVDELALAGAESLPDRMPTGEVGRSRERFSGVGPPPELRDRVVAILREFARRRP